MKYLNSENRLSLFGLSYLDDRYKMGNLIHEYKIINGIEEIHFSRLSWVFKSRNRISTKCNRIKHIRQ